MARLACANREFGEHGGVNPSIEISTTFTGEQVVAALPCLGCNEVLAGPGPALWSHAARCGTHRASPCLVPDLSDVVATSAPCWRLLDNSNSARCQDATGHLLRAKGPRETARYVCSAAETLFAALVSPKCSMHISCAGLCTPSRISTFRPLSPDPV